MHRHSIAPRLFAAFVLIAAACDSKSPAAPPSVAQIEVNPDAETLVVGETASLTATPRTADGTALTGRTVTWSSNAQSVATVSTTGVVTAVGAGTAMISAASEGQTGTAEITVRDGGVVPPTGTTISAAGGDVQIQVPPGAVGGTVAIEVVPEPNPPPHPQLVPGTSYHLGPDGTTFSSPVTLQFSYETTQLPAGAVQENLRLHRWNGSSWEELANGSVDVATRVVTGQTMQFSIFAIIEQRPEPVLSGIAPTHVVAGDPAFMLTVMGSGFAANSEVRWNGSARTTTFVSATQLTAQVPASDIATAGSAEVTVHTPAPGGGTSAAMTVTIQAPNPVPTLSALNPATVAAGAAAFTVTATGTNFVEGGQLHWNGSARPTTVVSATELTAQISAADVASAGNAEVTVVNPPPGGGSSAAQTLTIVPAELVVTTMDDTDDGACTPAHCSLREALNLAHEIPVPGRRIQLGAGSITLTDSLPAITVSMEIVGPGPAQLTIDANASVGNERRIFNITSAATVSISGLTLTGGRHNNGGAIAVRDTASITLTNAVITGNDAPSFTGGGMDVSSAGNVHVEDVTFSHNRVQGAGQPLGGGLAIRRIGAVGNPLADSVVMRNVTFHDNESQALGAGFYLLANPNGTRLLDNVVVRDNVTSSAGAGAYLSGPGPITIVNSTFDANHANGNGGGLAIGQDPEVHISGTTFSNNVAQGLNGGGAIWVIGGVGPDRLVIVNSTFSGNQAANGGALFTGASSLLRNVTLVGNRGTGGGAGIHIPFNNVVARMANVLLADNESTAGPASCRVAQTAINSHVESLGGNLSDDASCATYLTATGDMNSTAAGVSATLANNGGPTLTHALLPGSPAIDAGIPAQCPATDQRGYARQGACDIGAFEAGAVPPAAGGAGLRSAPRR